MQPRGLYLCFDVDADVICRINVPRNLQFAVLCFSVVHFPHTLNFFSLVSSSLLTAPSCDSLIAMLIRGRHLVVVFVTRSTCEVHMNYKWKPELLTSVERGILAALLRDFLIAQFLDAAHLKGRVTANQHKLVSSERFPVNLWITSNY